MNSYTYTLAVYDGELIAGGYFTTAGGVSSTYIARWDGSVWQPMGTGMGSTVLALTVYNGELIAGGAFLTAGGHVSAYWARWGVLRGDLNGDDGVDSADVDLFVAVLLGQDADWCRTLAADVDRSGAADAADIQPFVNALLGG